MLSKEVKSEIIKKMALSSADTGSSQVQIGLITKRINQIAEHLKKFPKDKHSRNGLLKLVGKRRKFSAYLKRTDFESYKTVEVFLSEDKEQRNI